MGLPSAEHFTRSQYTTVVDASTRKATGVASVALGPMVIGGTYELTSDVDAFFLQGASDVVAVTTTAVPIFAKQTVEGICCDSAATAYVAVILPSSTGVAWLVRVS